MKKQKNDIMANYINLVNKEFKDYMNIIYGGKKYNEEIFEQFMVKYIEERYIKLLPKKNSNQGLRTSILNEFLKLEKKSEQQDKNDNKIMCEIFSTIAYLDGVGSMDAKKVITKLEQIRSDELNINVTKEFASNIYQVIKTYQENKRELIKRYETKYFKLMNTKLSNNRNIYKTKLKYDIKFPEMYSEKVIDKVFNTGVTKEDKLFVEYNLINVQILKDSIKGNFDRNYIIEFQSTLLDKKSKLQRIISQIDNDYIKEKVSFGITTDEFTDSNKDDIYRLMRSGYKFAIIVKDNFYTDNIDKLEVFSYIIIQPEHNQYNEFRKNKAIEEKIVNKK